MKEFNHMFKKHTSKKKGYAILFAVVIISLISLLTIGLSNTTYKELVLTSVARDSSTSFFQSDTATECALYAENVLSLVSPYTPNPWQCGVNSSNNPINLTITDYGTGGYKALSDQGNGVPCFEFYVDRLNVVNPGDPGTDIKALGYNICDKTNPRTVERELDVTY